MAINHTSQHALLYTCIQNFPPSTQGPVTQAWGALLSIPGTIEATTSTGVSILSHDEFNCAINENAWLSNEITLLKQQMAALLKAQQQNTSSNNLQVEPTQNTPQSTMQLQKTIIMPEFITLVAQAMQQMQQMIPSDCKQQAQGITDHQEYKGLMDH